MSAAKHLIGSRLNELLSVKIGCKLRNSLQIRICSQGRSFKRTFSISEENDCNNLLHLWTISKRVRAADRLEKALQGKLLARSFNCCRSPAWLKPADDISGNNRFSGNVIKNAVVCICASIRVTTIDGHQESGERGEAFPMQGFFFSMPRCAIMPCNCKYAWYTGCHAIFCVCLYKSFRKRHSNLIAESLVAPS